MSDTWTCEWCGMVHRSALEYNNHTCSKRVSPVVDEMNKLDTLIACLPEAPFKEHLKVEVESLRQRVAELEKDIDDCPDCKSLSNGYNHALNKLAACEKERDILQSVVTSDHQDFIECQAHMQQLRDLVTTAHESKESFIARVKSILNECNTSALDAYVESKLAGEKQLRRDLEAFYAGAAVDAKRYRWLLNCGKPVLWVQCARMDSYDDVESAIDEAMKGQS